MNFQSFDIFSEEWWHKCVRNCSGCDDANDDNNDDGRKGKKETALCAKCIVPNKFLQRLEFYAHFSTKNTHKYVFISLSLAALNGILAVAKGLESEFK